MSSSYGRLAAIRDYWMPRNLDARVEVRVTDLDEILRELVRVTTLAADRAAPTPPAQDDEALVLTGRQRAIVSFALLRFINDAYAQANHHAQNGPVEHVSKFQDDARDAEEIRALLTKRGAA